MHLDDLAILVCDAPGVLYAFDMHHGGAQRLAKGAGRNKHGSGEYKAEQAQSAWVSLAMHSITPLCEPDSRNGDTKVKGKIPWEQRGKKAHIPTDLVVAPEGSDVESR